jgi:hypothetical protein
MTNRCICSENTMQLGRYVAGLDGLRSRLGDPKVMVMGCWREVCGFAAEGFVFLALDLAEPGFLNRTEYGASVSCMSGRLLTCGLRYRVASMKLLFTAGNWSHFNRLMTLYISLRYRPKHILGHLKTEHPRFHRRSYLRGDAMSGS